MTTQSNSMASPLAPQGIAPAALPETQPFYWSVRRELWENRYIYIVPLAVAASRLTTRIRSHGHIKLNYVDPSMPTRRAELQASRIAFRP